MASMSYCRFENTKNDMSNCVNDLQTADIDEIGFAEFMNGLSSNYERDAVSWLYEMAKDYVTLYEALSERETEKV